jgi:hypothetical protein
MKYKLTDKTKKHGEVTLYRIQALQDFGNVKAGEYGGWVENQLNLSQKGNCWVYGNAWVSGDALVSGDARVCGNTWVSGNTLVSGDALVYGDARVCGNTWVSGNALVSSNALPCTPEKSQVSEFNFSILPSEVEEVVIAGVRYKKETTWKKI